MMMLNTTIQAWTDRADVRLPAEVAMVLSALEAGRHGRAAADRRVQHRQPMQTAAALRLHADAGRTPIIVYTRDVGARNVGFVARQRLPLGYGGTIELLGPDGEPARIPCVLLRCSPAVHGWYDASAAFNRLQPQFE